MALSFFRPLLRHLDADPGMSFVHDPIDPAVNSRIDHFLDLDTSTSFPDDGDDDPRCDKMPRGAGIGYDADACLSFSPAGNGGSHGALHWSWSNGDGCQEHPQPPEFVMPLPAPPLFVRGADAKKLGEGASNGCRSAARERRKRISEKTAELSRLVPGGHRLNTAEMLHEAGRHVRLLQAQLGVLALMRTIHQQPSSMSPKERTMHALLASGGVQGRLAAEGKCLVPRNLVDAMAQDTAVKSNAALSRDLAPFADSLPVPEP